MLFVEALVDMSGGVEESFNLKEIIRKSSGGLNSSEDFWRILLQARRKLSVICCNIDPDPNRPDVQLPNGLVKGHAYVVTTLVTIPYKGKELRLLKCHNPWGTPIEWKEDWSKKSSLWKILSPNVRRDLLLEVQKQGQFW